MIEKKLISGWLLSSSLAVVRNREIDIRIYRQSAMKQVPIKTPSTHHPRELFSTVSSSFPHKATMNNDSYFIWYPFDSCLSRKERVKP